jgi:uncharacterized repeat protein (TIGR01451 family)
MQSALKRAKIVKFATICFILTIIIFINPTTNVFSSSHEIKENAVDYPRLFVTKTVNQAEITLEKSIIVTITIRNTGNSTAYNATFIDDLTAPWIFEVIGLTRLSYSRIEPNQTRTFSYLVKALTVGHFQLHSATVYYYTSDVQPSEFISFSNALDITVVEPPEDFSLANEYTVWTFALIFFILNIMLLLRLVTPKLNRRKI